MSSEPFPNFAHPPLDEIVLGIQFAPLAGFTAAHFGLFWPRVRPRFSRAEEKVALDPVIERFGESAADSVPRIRLSSEPETPRVWFIEPSERELLQLQRDRFHHNWRVRKAGDELSYPRYASLRQSFLDELRQVEAFAIEEQLGPLKPVQVELTYINNIPIPNEGGGLDPRRVFTTWATGAGGFLPAPRDPQFAMSFVMHHEEGAPVGRLLVQMVTARGLVDHSPLFRLDLTARGQPEGGGLDGVVRFLDRGHEWLVRAFVQLTTERMHEEWGRSDG